MLLITTPAGLEGFFTAMGTEAAEPTHPPVDLVVPPEDPDLGHQYGITALGQGPSWEPLRE